MEKHAMSQQTTFSEKFKEFEKSLGFKNDIYWFNVVWFLFFHVFAVYWCYHYAFPVKWQTILFAAIMYFLSNFGVHAGAHRLWSHKSFKVYLPMKLFLLVCYSSAGLVLASTTYHEPLPEHTPGMSWWLTRLHCCRPSTYMCIMRRFTSVYTYAPSNVAPLTDGGYGCLYRPIAKEQSLRRWIRDHRVHHKHSDTDADPYNSSRGFFFSHIGWAMMKKREEVIRRGKQIDMSDFDDQLLLRVYDRHNTLLLTIFCFVLPPLIGVWLWGESWQCSLAWQVFIRFLFTTHWILTINSFAHRYGYKPYNRNIKPTDNFLASLTTFGEGSHNYHHVFPVDYKTAEHTDMFNLVGKTIGLLAQIGWVYDLKEVNPEMVNSVARRLGDDSRVHSQLPAKISNKSTGK